MHLNQLLWENNGNRHIIVLISATLSRLWDMRVFTAASFLHHMWIQTGVTVRKRLCVDFCDIDPWPLTLTFCMDVTSVIGNNSWKFHDDSMKRAWSKMCNRQTGRRTDRQMDWTSQRAAWSQLKRSSKCRYIKLLHSSFGYCIFWISLAGRTTSPISLFMNSFKTFMV